jgi:hypothetical protein
MSLRARLALPCLMLLAAPAAAVPPFDGTVFIDPDVITPADPTTLAGLLDAGQGQRQMFDRRINAFATYNAFLFVAQYADAPPIEIQVNPEYGDVDAARQAAAMYAPIIGRLPRALRTGVETVWIHKGDFAFGGGNSNLLIHTGALEDSYLDLGVLEEVLAHEASHTSLDPAVAGDAAWLAAQQADGEFISTYARDNAAREDVAESFVPFFAVACHRDRLESGVADVIENTIPARFAYFAAQGYDFSPHACDDGSQRVFRNGFE